MQSDPSAGVGARTLPDTRRPTPDTSSGAPAIETRELRKAYGKITALAGLTMTVPRGEVFGFLGPNGAGKTTAVKLLVGLAPPPSGEATILGRPLSDVAVRAKIGYLPELFRYQGWLSAREVLAYHGELARMPALVRRREIDRVLDLVELAARGSDRVETFSKGMQQRLGLAVALLGQPELVFLDEPTSALDPVGRHDVRELIKRLKDTGTTVFLNSHLLSEVELVCDRVAVVDRGSVPELLGGVGSVRLRVEGWNGVAQSALQRYGPVEVEGDWYTVRAIPDGAIPDLVAEIVRLGGRVHAVEPRRLTLEDRFLQLLGDQP
jgi:ABC-2 type transport system ATP-binding protein